MVWAVDSAAAWVAAGCADVAGPVFRAIAERSMLADAVKDSGAVTMFPAIAETWLDQVKAQQGWEKFQLSDFQRLQQKYGVNWVVVKPPGVAGLSCPYHNLAVAVCRLD